ncbi:hypothetical protein Asp14428_76250 [Actinoplanes sp. NBRC 14428]|uniref:Antibiotic biosynthesis monooxygenase n=1 Tax=Pseudosporangium ferrugineum TaxID=439699 RepID=A0A2T0RXB6_9ACTN|nr:antibiotic biosynthesis monooxygenase family protein [Pseudosporangium ferrugineum]PRY25800.1 antibiotic biosynthesis monooxygenase [Pseudosporangium ferrugineum]BCJ56150.1 hypothetical protein Asp14428_76250 [Actinoplanes sp. NBRC 14428]
MTTPTGAVRAVLTMTVPRAAAADFEREWRRVSEWVRKQPGCLRQTLSRSGESELRYVITSDWTDALSYSRFEHSRRQDEQTAALRDLRTSVGMDVLTIIDHKEFS